MPQIAADAPLTSRDPWLARLHSTAAAEPPSRLSRYSRRKSLRPMAGSMA